MADSELGLETVLCHFALLYRCDAGIIDEDVQGIALTQELLDTCFNAGRRILIADKDLELARFEDICKCLSALSEVADSDIDCRTSVLECSGCFDTDTR